MKAKVFKIEEEKMKFREYIFMERGDSRLLSSLRDLRLRSKC